jgi:hypothetical protein
MTFYESRQTEIDRTAASVSESFRDLPRTEGVVMCIATTSAFLQAETNKLLDMSVADAECML